MIFKRNSTIYFVIAISYIKARFAITKPLTPSLLKRIPTPLVILSVAKYPNLANLNYERINVPKANQNNLAWWIRDCVVGRTLLFAKAKSSKNFV